MKRFLTLLTIALTCLSLFSTSAEARRFGGGGSFGKQRTFSQQQMQRAPAAAPATAAQPPAPQSAGNRWLGPLAGLAIGAGLGAMFAHFGMGGAMGGIVMALLAVMAVMLLLALLRRPRPAIQYAGRMPYGEADAMMTPQHAGGSAARNYIPADFPVQAFLRSAKTSFIRLQAANDRKDLDDIREYTTPEMFAEISMQLQERGHAPQKTDVLALEAALIEVASEGSYAIASVRMTGLLCENGGPPQGFDEIWNVQKNLDDPQSVWLLAGIQQVV
jgi:predicted lipid-binding transport protein (Tim44 family)